MRKMIFITVTSLFLYSDFIESESPVDIMPAEVISVSSIEIRLNENDKLIIPADLIIIPKRLRSGEGEELKMGENLMVVSLKGGQSFFILDKI
ncbi:Phage-like element PBSX protein; skin element [Bacillus velezensis UCMB5036]|nr:phage portal protein [Bacillus sp. Pc3]AMR51103.1 phage portal protein [Bacillus amyloliquefaciens]ANB48837.1 phage portal protein [Bacillus velezensis]OXS84846.1 phage portal protein [Bacillus sp. LYLB4]CCP22365.1 Phage-like element PBSX protein; skin element [Bacillus velezensis UCMB5036]